VTHYGELVARCRAHAAAKELVGTWEAYNIHGRIVDATPMPGAGLTEISIRSRYCWSAGSHILQVNAVDVSDGRHHSGTLVIDSVCPRLATRILIYEPGDEVMEQRIVISQDFRTLYVFIVAATLGLSAYSPAHALRRRLS
jgi:hypothetical protein